MTQALTARLRAVEARLAELEEGYGATLYELRRESVRTRLTLASIAEQVNATVATDAEVDAELD